MDLRQLRTFMQVAQLGSLTRAAESLRVAQPALGRQIKLLEDELGVTLFARHGRGMLLTSPGRILLERAQSIFRLVEDTRAEVAAEQDVVKGSVSLGVPPTVGEILAGRLVEQFLRRYPAVTVRIVPAFSGYLQDLLQRGEVDLAVMYAGTGTSQTRTEPLIVEDLVLVGSSAAALEGEEPVDFARLQGLPMILPGPRQGLRALLEQEARKAGIALTVSVEADALHTLKDLARRGLGYTVLPLPAVHAELEEGTLRAAPITRPSLARKLVLARSLTRPASTAARIFAQTLKAEIVAMVDEGLWRGEVLIRGATAD